MCFNTYTVIYTYIAHFFLKKVGTHGMGVMAMTSVRSSEVFPSFTNGWNEWAERTKFTYRIEHGQSNVDLVSHGLGIAGTGVYDRLSGLHGVHMMVYQLFSRRLRGLGNRHLCRGGGSEPCRAIARARAKMSRSPVPGRQASCMRWHFKTRYYSNGRPSPRSCHWRPYA